VSVSVHIAKGAEIRPEILISLTLVVGVSKNDTRIQSAIARSKVSRKPLPLYAIGRKTYKHYKVKFQLFGHRRTVTLDSFAMLMGLNPRSLRDRVKPWTLGEHHQEFIQVVKDMRRKILRAERDANLAQPARPAPSASSIETGEAMFTAQ